MKKDFRIWFQDAFESIELIERYTEGLSEKEFLRSVESQDMIIRRLAIIGEALSHVPEEIRQQYPDIRWKAIVGMRNYLVHEYFDVSFGQVWKVASQDIPVLKKQILVILEKEGTPEL